MAARRWWRGASPWACFWPLPGPGRRGRSAIFCADAGKHEGQGMSDRAPLLIIAAGGTGGHMFPAQALAEVMLRRGWRVRLSTGARGARYVGGFPHSVDIEQVASATFARGTLFNKLLAPLHILGGVLGAALRMRRDRPDAVVGFGGYPTIPALVAACGTWPTDLPEGVEGVHVGNPVRAAVLERAGAPFIPPGDYPMSLLVIGGSQGARILSDVVPGAVAALPEPILRNLRVSHQAREEDMDRVAKFYADAGIDADVQLFFRDVPARMSEAQLVISRAGASSIADISVIGRPAILIPYAAAAADHQSANARGLVEAGGAILIPESKLDSASLSAQIAAVLEGAKGANMMAQAALSQGLPDAPQRLADMVEELARKGQDR